MTDARETCVQGVTAFRNVRDLAKRHRDSFIASANAKARQSAEIPLGGDDLTGTTEVPHDQESSSDEFVDCEDTGSQDVERPLLPADVDENSASQDDARLPQYLYEEDDQQSKLAASLDTVEHLTSATASFTSSFTADGLTSKRSAATRSPPSSPRRHKRHLAKKSAKGRKPALTTPASASTASQEPPPAG